jgi:hypothetical protein
MTSATPMIFSVVGYLGQDHGADDGGRGREQKDHEPVGGTGEPSHG